MAIIFVRPNSESAATQLHHNSDNLLTSNTLPCFRSLTFGIVILSAHAQKVLRAKLIKSIFSILFLIRRDETKVGGGGSSDNSGTNGDFSTKFVDLKCLVGHLSKF